MGRKIKQISFLGKQAQRTPDEGSGLSGLGAVVPLHQKDLSV